LATKSENNEQFVCGFVAAFITKIWVAMLSNLMRHPKLSSRYLEQSNYLTNRASRRAKIDIVKYWVGMTLAIISISKNFQSALFPVYSRFSGLYFHILW
jgi:hypothetical protein